MSLLIGFLTFVLVVNCLFLMLLVLVQLPKKEAGAGLAFGAGAVDTLIGAGSGNALTKLTKYAAGTFLGMAILLAVLNAQRHQGSSRALQQELARKSSATSMLPPTTPPSQSPTAGQLAPSKTETANNAVLSLTNIATPAATPSVATTNAAAAPQQTPATTNTAK